MRSTSAHADATSTTDGRRCAYCAVAALVVVNVVVYVLQLVDDGVAEELALRSGAGDVIERPWTVFTAMFLHEHALHLVLMLAGLVVFGGALGRQIRARFVIAVYVAAGVAGAAAFLATAAVVDIDDRAVGASAAVLGLAAAFIALRPDGRLAGGRTRHWLAAIVVANLALAASAPGSSAAHLAGVAVGLGAGWLLKGDDGAETSRSGRRA
jgi:membrane associated rhomboid family serine protease